MGRKPRQPAKDGTITGPSNNIEPIRPQITSMIGDSSIDSVIENAPESTVNAPQRGPNGRLLKKDGTERAEKKRKQSTLISESQDLMNDPLYRKAIQGMNFFGAPRVTKRAFSIAADIADDESIKLTKDEEEHVDSYFYAVSKHTAFDPMASIVGRLIMLVLLLGELIGTRIFAHSDLGKNLKEMVKGKTNNVIQENINQDQEKI